MTTKAEKDALSRLAQWGADHHLFTVTDRELKQVAEFAVRELESRGWEISTSKIREGKLRFRKELTL